MSQSSAPPIRKARPVCVSVDLDAHAILHQLCPNSKGMGLFLSELIRKEARERLDRPAMLARLAMMGAVELID